MGTGSGDDDRTRLSFQPCAHTSGMPPFPSAHPPIPSAPPPHFQVISPIPYPCACSSPPHRHPTPHEARAPSLPPVPGRTLILHPPPPLGEGSTHGIIPRLPKGETEARKLGWGNREAVSQPPCPPRYSPRALLSAPLSPLLFSGPGHRPFHSHRG